MLFLNERFDVISGEESSGSVENPFPPAVIVLLDHEYYGIFVKCQLVLFVPLVVVYRHN